MDDDRPVYNQAMDVIAELKAEIAKKDEEIAALTVAKYPGCKVLTLGDKCPCKICILEREIAALAEGNLEAQHRAVIENQKLREEIAALQRWKAESLEVEASWDCQEVGKAIGVKLGGNIRKEILPYILKQQAHIKELEGALERKNEQMISGKDFGRIT